LRFAAREKALLLESITRSLEEYPPGVQSTRLDESLLHKELVYSSDIPTASSELTWNTPLGT